MITVEETACLKNTILCDVHEDKWLEIMNTLEALWRVVEAAKNWERMRCVAEKNPEGLLSGMLSDEASKIMQNYYESERLLLDALSALAPEGK